MSGENIWTGPDGRKYRETREPLPSVNRREYWHRLKLIAKKSRRKELPKSEGA